MFYLVDTAFAIFVGYQISKLLNAGEFDVFYCIAAVAGTFTIPSLVSLVYPELVEWGFMKASLCAVFGVFAYDGVKRFLPAIHQ